MKIWFKKEKDSLMTSILAMFGIVFAVNFTKISVFGQPYNIGLSICLLIFCLLFTVKNHFAEIRLKEFYEGYWKSLKDSERSFEQILDELYIYIRHLLCLSVIHFYIFLIVFSIYAIMLLDFNYTNYHYAKSIKNGYKFNLERKYKSWFYIKIFEFIMICAVVCLILKRVDFTFVAFLFFGVLFFLEICLDWFMINADFYIKHFVREE